MASRRSALWRQDRTAYLFLLPWLVGFFGLTLGPMIGSFYLSLTKYNLLNAPQWLGLDNYAQIFAEDELFRRSIALTFQYVLLAVPLRLFFALMVAMALNKGIRMLARASRERAREQRGWAGPDARSAYTACSGSRRPGKTGPGDRRAPQAPAAPQNGPGDMRAPSSSGRPGKTGPAVLRLARSGQTSSPGGFSKHPDRI
ncbi:hypothetical protein GCM10027018_13110 [Paenibacillus thermoaerophilus]